MNSHREDPDDQVDRWLQTWGSKGDCQVNPTVRERLIHRAARSRRHLAPSRTFALAAAAGLAVLLGAMWIAIQNPTPDPKQSIANAESEPDFQQWKKKSQDNLASLELETKLLQQKLMLIELQTKIEQELSAIRSLSRDYEHRVKLDRIILESLNTPDHATEL